LRVPLFFNASGQFVAGPSLGTAARDQGGDNGGDPANFDLCGNYVDAPTTGYMALLIRMNGNNGVNPYVFWTEPMMGKLAPGQTVLPPYTDGPNDPNADQTIANTSAGFLGQTAFATAPTITRGNVASYFNYSAFSLGYSITRSDGTTTVTEALAITQLGISAGIVGQSALATLDQAGTEHIAAGATYQMKTVEGQSGTVTSGQTGASGTVSATSTGGQFKIDVQADGIRTGGAGGATIQLFVSINGGIAGALSRPVNFSPTNTALPVCFFALGTWPAGTTLQFFFQVTAASSSSTSWAFQGGQIAVTEYKR
jgi:hypothetical protein